MLYVNKRFLYFSFLLFSTPFFVWISICFLNNPDVQAYKELMESSDVFSLGIEPTLFLFSMLSKFFSRILNIDPLFLFYYQYIFLIQLFLFLGFYNIFKRNMVLSFFSFVMWFFAYGIIHCLIQIRFGLANALFFYVFSLYFIRGSLFKVLGFGFLGVLTHYSSVLAVVSLLYIRFRKLFSGKDSYKVVHLVFICFLLFFKAGSILNFLPEFMLGRISGYINNSDVDSISSMTISISLFCYFVLIFCPKLVDERLNSLRIYGALSFLPYFIVPDIEILVRLGIAFQYLLLPYLILTARYKKVLFFSTIPLSIFFLYKFYSGINSLIEYSLL